VPVLMIGSDQALADGRLADVAPTILGLMGIDQPSEMTGTNLLTPLGSGVRQTA